MNEQLSIGPCNLCPRLCGMHRASEQRGICGATDELVIARAALHFWEEPPISGEAGSGTVFFSGCPLHCVYCQNREIAGGGHGRVASIERLAQICLELQAQGALNINFVTPTHYSLQICEAVASARAQGLSLPIVWNTSGYERVQTVRALAGTVDVYLADFKYADSMLAERYSHVPDYPQVALAALDEMVAQVGTPRFGEMPCPTGNGDDAGVAGRGGERHEADGMRPVCEAEEGEVIPAQACMTRGVIVRHLLLPGAKESSKEALRMLFERFGGSVLYSIMNQYTPVMPDSLYTRFPELASPVSAEDYEEVLDFADNLGMQDYFWQDGPAALESFIPAWDGEGV